jgi:hypothetical protein
VLRVEENWGKWDGWMKESRRGLHLGSATMLRIASILVKQWEAVSMQNEFSRETFLFVVVCIQSFLVVPCKIY